MPPKKSEKAIAAEIKKKNTAEANDIVAMLKRSSQRDKILSGKSSKTVDSSTMERLFDSAKTAKTVDPAKTGNLDAVANPPKHGKSSANESKKKNVDAAKEKKTSRKDTVSNATTTNAAAADNFDSIEVQSEKRGSGCEIGVTAADLTGSGSSGITKNVKALPEKTRKYQSKKPDQIEAKSKASNKVNSVKSATKKPKEKGSGTGYQYSIDCKLVADSIDVNDLKGYLETHLKVNMSTVKICCEGHKVVVKSAVYLPKKTLRFLSKKFLKKNWNIRVVSQNVHSYEYKYVGTL